MAGGLGAEGMAGFSFGGGDFVPPHLMFPDARADPTGRDAMAYWHEANWLEDGGGLSPQRAPE